MRIFLFGLIILGGGYLYFEEPNAPPPIDAEFRMEEREAPERTGPLTEKNRDDLLVPYSGSGEYSVPQDTVAAATTHQLNGRQWHSYRPRNRLGMLPVVILFHGAGRDGLSMIDMWRDTADKNGLLLVALDGRQQNWPAENVAPTILHDILSEAADLARIDEDRIYLFGHSNGARYVQSLINLTKGPWRAAAVHAGYGDPATAIVPADPKPIRFYLGTRDHIFDTETARIVARALSDKGHPTDLHLIPNHTHWFYEAGPLIAADAWAWFARL